jgi:2-haloacid dehalogenase
MDALCFDLFGTLCHTSVVRETFLAAFEDATGGSAAEAEAAYEEWQDVRSEFVARTAAMDASATFRGTAERSLDYVLDRRGVDLPRADREAVVDTYARLDPYEGVDETLGALAGSFELAVLSNGDAGLLREIVAGAGIARHFDRVISAGDSGVFKPAPAAYEHAADTLDRPLGTCWLVSAHPWDARGGAQAGMLAAWVNRDGLPDPRIGRRPTVTVDAFADLDGALGD